MDKLVGMPLEGLGFYLSFSMRPGFATGHWMDRISTPDFAIYDTEDQKSLMKSVCKQLQVDTKLYKERALMSAISGSER